ncbi:MAG: ATP-dependent DNA helicase, partial [Verrucomicrobia bacterium]|nr:ATP-dependent DNA helicase [Verrucomicrobiota bacterium]
MIALREHFDEDGASLVARARAIFAPGGLMSRAKNFEYRAEQERLAGAVARALATGRHLVAEAGTGVGKSLAYLAPAVLFALENERKALVSTHTINLQEQLIYKDLPILQKLLPDEFETALFKGRQNYLCPRRLARARQGTAELFTGPEASELDRVYLWSLKTRDGSLSDLPREPSHHVWSQVCSESHICTPKSCGPESGCFYQNARRRVAQADVVVLNHALFFTLLAATLAGEEDVASEKETKDKTKRPEGLLFDDDFAIFDEAHTVEAVAAKQLGLGVSQFGLRATLGRLYNPRTKKGLWSVLRDAEGVRRTTNVLEETEKFFDRVGQAADFKRAGREARVREPELVPDTLSSGLDALRAQVAETARTLADEPTRAELADVARRLGAMREGVATFLRQGAEDYVYWVEKTGKTESFFSLNAAPVDVSVLLRPLLFREGRSVIFTSATLAVGGSELGYFRERVGADGEEVDAVQIGSPFDFKKQMKVYVAARMPEARSLGYDEALARETARYLDLSKGRAFVLFTSYRQMQALAARMRDTFFRERGWQLLVQGESLSRRRMLDEFKADRESVLFGTESFWSGVDVPGDALGNVIITQLPFAPPDSPLTEARCELIKENGGDPFSEYSLPEAILRFRQGVGRLIRTKSDTGIVAVLDSRLV